MALDWLSGHVLDVVLALLILAIGGWLSRRLSKLIVVVIERRGLDKTLGTFLSNISYYVMLIVVFIAAAGQLGIDTMSFVTVLGAAGLAIGLALKDSLSSFASGVMLIIFKPFAVDDYIEAGGVAGGVEEITIFTTRLRSVDNKTVIVPNSSVTAGPITNYTARETRRVDLVFGIGYDDDLRKAKELLERMLADDERVLEDPAPQVAVSALGDSSVDFIVRPWVKTGDYWDVYWDMTERVKLAFDEAGITIPYPQQDVHLHREKSV